MIDQCNLCGKYNELYYYVNNKYICKECLNKCELAEIMFNNLSDINKMKFIKLVNEESKIQYN